MTYRYHVSYQVQPQSEGGLGALAMGSLLTRDCVAGMTRPLRSESDIETLRQALPDFVDGGTVILSIFPLGSEGAS